MELSLVAVNIFAPGFTIETSVPDPNFTFDPGKVICYRGIVKGNQNSLVAVTINGDEIMGMISDSTGNHVLVHELDKSALSTDYAFYDERAVQSEVSPFGCGTTDSSVGQVQSTNPVKVPGLAATTSISCISYLGIYAEVDNKLYQYYGGTTTAKITFLLNQVFATYENEGMYVRLSGLYIWNIPDPYNFNSTGANSSELDQYTAYWNARENNFPGQIACLLSGGVPQINNLIYGAGGIAWRGSLNDKSRAYCITTLNSSRAFESFPTYSRGVKGVAHEIGHSIGAHHTQWCGWIGGALDNCAPTENDAGDKCNCCPPGPPPSSSGGSIMSYCDSNIQSPVYLGFATQPGENQIGDLLRTEVGNASINFSITTKDGSLPSLTSGNWTSGSTWFCDIIPSEIYDVTISSGTTVKLNTNVTPKSLNINGTLDLSTSNSIIKINN